MHTLKIIGLVLLWYFAFILAIAAIGALVRLIRGREIEMDDAEAERLRQVFEGTEYEWPKN